MQSLPWILIAVFGVLLVFAALRNARKGGGTGDSGESSSHWSDGQFGGDGGSDGGGGD